MLLALLHPTAATMRWVRALFALLPLLLPLAMLRAFWLGQSTGWVDLFAWFPLFVYFIAFTLIDYVIGRDTTNEQPGSRFLLPWFRALPLLAVPVYCATLVWAMAVAAGTSMGWIGKLGWALSMGTVSGVLAINVAHELIHKRMRIERGLGGFLLSCVGYATFKVEHVHGHHVWVATSRDPSTARRGEGIYAFLGRAMALNVANAWRLQIGRLRRNGHGFWSFRNELLGWSLLSVALAFAAAVVFGAEGLLFFLVQALAAIMHLEIINYIEHYGLERRHDANGGPEPVTEQHSWNSAYFVSNAYLFQLQRHSDHHAHAGRPYNELQHHDSSPQLPGGYGAMVLLALVPPAWRAVIDRRLPAERQI